MNKKLIRKMLTASGGPFRIKFTPEQIAEFERLFVRVPGTNNSGGNRYREEGVLALQHLKQEAERKEEEIKSRMEMRPTLKRKATFAEKLQGKKDEYELVPLVIGMSGADPLLSFYVGGVGLNGIGTLAKTGLWNAAKYAPTTQLGNWGRGYFVENSFKNSFNGTVPTLASQATSLLYLPAKLNETGLTSLKFFERRPSKISLAERVGVPKGERDVWDPQVMLNAKEFANKYGYEVPLTIEEIKNMYRQHNRFFRSVETDRYEPKVGNTFFEYAPNYKPGMSEEEVIHGLYPEFKGLTPQQLRFTLASRGYPLYDRTYKISDIGKGPLDDFVFVSPSLAENAAYANSMGTNFSNTVMLQRPFSFGKPADWHINADWRPSEKVYKAHTKGQVSEGNSALKNEAKISTKHLIPVKIAEKGDLGTFLGDYLEKQKYKGSLPYEINIPINKQGGEMNIIDFLKKGSGIHIKKENRGKFTDYCGGKVTSECIARGKASSNPAIRKRATFAANARKWKHRFGGLINKFLQGGAGWGLLASSVVNAGMLLYAANKLANAKKESAYANNKLNYQNLQELIVKDAIEKMNQEKKKWLEQYLSGQSLDNSWRSDAFTNYVLQLIINQKLVGAKNKYELENALAKAKAESEEADAMNSAFSDVIQNGLGTLFSNLGNKKITDNSVNSTNNLNINSNNFWDNSTIKNSLVTGDFWNNPTIANSLA